MPNILIVEDDSFKSDDLLELIVATCQKAVSSNVSNVASAVATIRTERFDLIVLDMALPSHPVISGGGAPMSLLTGGMEVIFELESLGRDDDCVIITQYPEIEICGQFFPVEKASLAIKEHYGCNVLACLEYSDGSDAWRSKLKDILKKYANTST